MNRFVLDLINNASDVLVFFAYILCTGEVKKTGVYEELAVLESALCVCLAFVFRNLRCGVQ